MMKKFRLLFALLLGLGAWAQDLQLDVAHSKVAFVGSKFGGISVNGEFKQFSGEVAVSAPLSEIKILRGVVRADSVDSQSKKRDENIRGAKLLESDKFPEFSFQMSKYEPAQNGKGRVFGELDLHGFKKQVVLDSEISESKNSEFRAILKLKGEVDIQKDFGMKSYAMMSDKIKIDVILALK